MNSFLLFLGVLAALTSFPGRARAQSDSNGSRAPWLAGWREPPTPDADDSFEEIPPQSVSADDLVALGVTRRLARELEKFNGKVRLAPEFEINPRSLSGLMKFYDFHQLTETLRSDPYVAYKVMGAISYAEAYAQQLRENSNFPRDNSERAAHAKRALVGAQEVAGLLDDYFESQVQVDDFKSDPVVPEDIKKSLFGGLDLSRPSVVLAGTADLSRIESVMQRVHGDTSTFVKRGGLFTPAALEWQTLNARWNALPLDLRIKLVNYDVLPDVKKATLLKAVEAKLDLSQQGRLFKIKSGSDAEFLRNFNEHIDRGSVEYNFSGPMTNVLQFVRAALLFAKNAGIWRFLEAPHSQSLADSSYHLHISTLEDKDLEPVVQRLKLEWGLKEFKAGRLTYFQSGKLFTYSPVHSGKNALKLVSKNHLELRFHVEGFFEELLDVLHLITIPTPQAVNELDERIRALADPQLLARKRATEDSDGTLQIFMSDLDLLIGKPFPTCAAALEGI